MKFDLKYLLFILFSLLSLASSGKNHDYVVISKNEDVSVRNQKLFTRTELLLQINSREGEKAGEFMLYYSQIEKLSKLKAWIQDTTGQVIRKLENKQIKDQSAFFYGTFYSDYKVRIFELKHNKFPYQIHVEYCYEYDQFLQIAEWSPMYETEAPTLKATLSLEIPLNYPVKILRQKIDLPAIDTIGGTIRYQWTGEYLHLIKQETCQPPDDNLKPFLFIVPVEFEYGVKGSFASWKTFGDYVSNLIDDLGTLPESEISRIRSITSGVTDTLEMIRKIYRYLQDNTRYLCVTIDIGGIKPYPASFVAQNKYGDCKALSLYMKSLLEVAGIQSFFTFVEGELFASTIDTSFPAESWFNHSILCIPINSDTLWLDCTSRELPVGYTSVFIQGRPALIVCKEGSRLANIPFLEPEDVIVNHTLHYATPVSGSMEVTVHSCYKGHEFEKILFYSEEADKEKQMEFAKKLLPSGNYELKNYTFTRRSKDDFSIIFDAHLTVKNDIKTVDDRIIFTPPAVNMPDFEKISVRENPVVFPYPIWYHDTISVEIPAGMTVKSFPATELSCETGSYKVTSSLDHNNLIYIRDIFFRRGESGLENYPALYNWTGAIRAFERQNQIIFTPIHE